MGSVSSVSEFWLAVAGLAATCLAAIGARSLAEFSPHELKEICRRRKSPDRLGQILRGRDQVALAAETLQVVATVTFVAAGALLIWRADPQAGLPSLAAIVSNISSIKACSSGVSKASTGADTWRRRGSPILSISRTAIGRFHSCATILTGNILHSMEVVQ